MNSWPQGDVHWGGVVAVCGMYAVFLLIGWLASRKLNRNDASDFLVAGRNMPLWLATLTMTATWVDGGYLLGTAEGVFSNLASGFQGGVCFGLSLILGGLFFAKKMRQLGFTTLIDPFERRFGKRWAAVLAVPALMGGVFWSAELLVAIGATFHVLLHVNQATAIFVSAIVVTAYTRAGGMWSVAYTDAFQLGLIPLGLLAALPYAAAQVGGLSASWEHYVVTQQDAAQWIPLSSGSDSYWTLPKTVDWWNLSLMSICGGIPWNCYFQRALSCQTPERARWHSIWAGVLTIVLTIPPLLLGLIAFKHWGGTLNAPHDALPLLLRDLTPPVIGFLGLAAIIGAVTSSFSASILSAGSMWTWNVYQRLLVPDASNLQMQRMIRTSIVLLGAAAVGMALGVRSVQALWFFTSDLILVLLFPQLLAALFDRKANRVGSITGFVVALVLRLGGGEPLLGLRPWFPYPYWFQAFLPSSPETWYDAQGGLLFPYKALAMLANLVLVPLVSRLTQHWNPARPL